MVGKLIKLINHHLPLVLLGLLVLRVGYLFINGLDLVGDESYYWDWSRKPDWCYYSKPPMVAWLIGIFTWLGGDYTAMVRLPAVLLGTVFLGYFYATARAFYSPIAAAFALLMILATPFNVIQNFIMTIDPPLYCFWMMSLYYLCRALFDGDQRAWLWAGLATGAAVLSKQSALLLPLMLIIFLLIRRERWPLFQRGFLVYLLPIIACLIPLFLWNQQHDWVMLGHSKGHFGNKEALDFFSRLANAGAFWLFQFLLATPIFFVLIVNIAVKNTLRFKQLRQEEQFLMLMGPLLLLVILALSLVQKVQGNWPIPFYFTGLILLAGYWDAGYRQKWLQNGLAVGYSMVAITYTLPLIISLFNLHNTAVDPTYRFRHWHELAANIDTVRHQTSADNAEQSFVIALGHRYLASQLAFYLPDHPQVFRYEASGLVTSQYEVWPGPQTYLGKTGFIVSEQNEAAIPSELKSAFQIFKEVASIPNPMNKDARYYLYIGENLKQWPPKANKE